MPDMLRRTFFLTPLLAFFKIKKKEKPKAILTIELFNSKGDTIFKESYDQYFNDKGKNYIIGTDWYRHTIIDTPTINIPEELPNCKLVNEWNSTK